MIVRGGETGSQLAKTGHSAQNPWLRAF